MYLCPSIYLCEAKHLVGGLWKNPGIVQRPLTPISALRYTRSQRFPGGSSEVDPPVPIPNTEVKRLSADDTALARVWENKPLPGFPQTPRAGSTCPTSPSKIMETKLRTCPRLRLSRRPRDRRSRFVQTRTWVGQTRIWKGGSLHDCPKRIRVIQSAYFTTQGWSGG